MCECQWKWVDFYFTNLKKGVLFRFVGVDSACIWWLWIVIVQIIVYFYEYIYKYYSVIALDTVTYIFRCFIIFSNDKRITLGFKIIVIHLIWYKLNET